MGYKYVKIDESGAVIPSHQYDQEAVSYDLRKTKGVFSGVYIRREIGYSNTKGGRKNYFEIDDNTQSDGAFVVSWKNVYVAPRPAESKDGKIVLDYQADMVLNIKLGEFQKLKDAELYAIKFALDFGNVKPFYGYHPLFEKEGLTIEDIPMVFNWDDSTRPIQIKCPVVDKSVIQENKERAKRRLLEKEARLNGKEDTRIMVKVLLNINLNDLNEALASHLENEVSVIDGVGADGESTYNVDEVDVKVKSTGAIEATFYLERESGKFASADDLRAEIVNQIGANATVEIPIELVE